MVHLVVELQVQVFPLPDTKMWLHGVYALKDTDIMSTFVYSYYNFSYVCIHLYLKFDLSLELAGYSTCAASSYRHAGQKHQPERPRSLHHQKLSRIRPVLLAQRYVGLIVHY